MPTERWRKRKRRHKHATPESYDTQPLPDSRRVIQQDLLIDRTRTELERLTKALEVGDPDLLK